MRNKSSAQNFRLNSALHQRYCMTCCDLLGRVGFGWAGDSALDRTGISATLPRTKVPSQISGQVPSHTRQNACVVNFGWGGDSGLESPNGRSLRHARSKDAPYQKFRGTSARCLHEHEISSDKVAGDSALVSPKIPESPPLQE